MHRDKYEAKLQELDSKEREFSDYKRDVRAHFNVWSKPLVLELKLSITCIMDKLHLCFHTHVYE